MKRIDWLAGVLLLAGLPVIAQQPAALTLEEALERAQQSAPAIVAARMRIEEARGRVPLPFPNPAVEAKAGRRSGALPTTDYGVELGQDLELPQARRARRDAARAGVTQEEQRAREAERETLREVATALLRAVEARERAATAESSRRLADDALRIAERRYAAGDVAQLDVNLARTAVARGNGEARIANATLSGRTAQLQALLGLTEPVTVSGSLRDLAPLTATDLFAYAASRPDVRILDAEIAEAEADQRLARTLRWPGLGVVASYASEEGDRIVLGGLALTLPLFDRGQVANAVARARLARLHAQREALIRTIEAEVRGAVTTHDALRAAASDYERTVLPLVDENEKLALESYEAGQIGLADLLLVRREALDARRDFLDQLIETRLAEVELRALAGVWK